MSDIEFPSLRRVELREHRAEGWLAIDRCVHGRSFGGLRIVPDLDQAELLAAARTMTLKYAFAGLAMGGAKAALRLPAGVDLKARHAALSALGLAWRKELATGRWTPAIDMGIDLSDLRALLSGARIDLDLTNWREHSHQYTAWSVLASIQAACAVRRVPLAGARVLLEGYGRVGSALMPLLAANGARLVGVSTRDGAVVQPRGIDIDQLEALRATHGDGCVNALEDVTTVEHLELLLQEAEISIPCARANAIDDARVERVISRIIVCAANAPLTRRVERRLFERGVTVIPDFVANAGGTVGSVLDRYAKPATIRQIIQQRLSARVIWMLEQADTLACAPVDVAEEHALNVLSQVESGARRWPSGWSLALAARSPAWLRDAAARIYAGARLYPG